MHDIDDITLIFQIDELMHILPKLLRYDILTEKKS